MEFLKEVGFSDKLIDIIEENIPSEIKKSLCDYRELAIENINFLKDLGVTNYQEAFMAYPSMFIMNIVDFKEVFNKYDREDLIKKIEKNVAIIEHL